MKKLSKQEIIDILHGCAVLGTGGGGNLEDGLAMMEEDFAQGRDLSMVSLSELPDDCFVATPYCCGAPKGLDEEEDERFRQLPHLDYPPSLLAFRSLEEYIGEKFFAVSSTELGGANTAEALHTACQLGLPIIDADPAGRSVPELQHSTYFVKNKAITPMTVATDFGEVIIIKDVIDDFRAEDVVRAIAVASGAMVGVTDHPMTGRDYKEAIIPDAITYALKIGETLRETRMDGGRAVADAISDKFNGKYLFHGKLKSASCEKQEGFNVGELCLEGIEDFLRQEYIIRFKNENIISYRDGEVDVVVPDLICMLDRDGNPVTTPNFIDGMEMNIFALPAPEIWKTPDGIKCFGPEHFGLPVHFRNF